MKYLGPLSSSTTNSRQFYVDLDNQLETDETLSTVTLECNDGDVTITNETILSTDFTTRDGQTLTTGKSLYFRASCGEEKTAIAAITVSYTTSDSNSDSTTVYLKIVPTII